MNSAVVDADELVEFWTLLEVDRELLIDKWGAIALGFVLLLKHYSRHGAFPHGRSDLHDSVIDFVARQVGVGGSEVGPYEWSGSTIESHRAHVHAHLDFRVAPVADQQEGTAWHAVNVAHAERRPERVREGLLSHFGVLGSWA